MRPRIPDKHASARSQGSERRLPRTRALLLGLLSALLVVAWLPALARAEEEIQVVMMEEEERELGRGAVRGELEASMRSSLLLNFQEASLAMRALEEAEAMAATRFSLPSVTQQGAAPAATTAFPDSSAVVGRIFQMKVPDKMEDGYLGDVVKRADSKCSRQNKRKGAVFLEKVPVWAIAHNVAQGDGH
ncbi:unnamed protein product [Merluccius merluccius]